MHTSQTTIVVIGADSRQGLEWLTKRFPATPKHTRALVVHLRRPELDAILWAEELRLDARQAGIRLSIGLAARAMGDAVQDAARAAGDAFERAFALGGDITVTHANLLRAA